MASSRQASRAVFVLAMVLAAVFLAGLLVLPGVLGLNMQCVDGFPGRHGVIVTAIGCVMADGAAGWFYILWATVPLALLGWWLSRALGSRRWD